MKRQRFGRTELMVTPLGFGAAEVGYLGIEQAQIARVLETVLDSGVNVIDTAAAYPGSEAAIGKAISPRRDEFVLVSKCGRHLEGLPGDEWSPRVVTATLDRSLSLLRTDHIDVMLLHSPPLSVLEKGEALAALVRAREAGKVRFVGYSGDNEAAEYAAALDDVAVIETSISIADQRNIEVVLPVAAHHDCGVIAKRPIANAAWKKAAEQPGFYAEYASTYAERLSEMALEPTDLGFAGKPSEVWHEVALRFTLSQRGVHTAVVGTTNPDHVRANVEAAMKGPLPRETLSRIRDAFRVAEAGSDEVWMGMG